MTLDLTDIYQIQQILRNHGTKAKKFLGQNFLTSKPTLDKIIEAGNVNHTDQVLEIGTGLGVLTNELLKKTKKLISLEMDPDMIKITNENIKKLHSAENLVNWDLINVDALKYDIENSNLQPGYKIIANIPYFITSPLLRHFLKDQYLKNSKIIPSTIVFLIQKEVAEKITDEKKQSVIGLNIKIFGDPKIIAFVPSTDFTPSPKVDSAILQITVYDSPKINMEKINFQEFFSLIEAGFRSPRKKLSNNISNYISAKYKASNEQAKTILASANIDGDLRAEKLTIKNWEELYLQIKQFLSA